MESLHVLGSGYLIQTMRPVLALEECAPYGMKNS